MKNLLIAVLLFFFIPAKSQFDRLAGGIGFSSGVDILYASSGNPAIFGKSYLKIMPRLHLIGSLSAFNKGEAGSSLSGDIRKNYMLHGDIDLQYGLFREDKLRLMGFTGFNMTTMFLRFESSDLNQSVFKPGLNLGAALEMNINNSYDALLSGKYILGECSQFVIQIGVIYQFTASRRYGW